MMKYAAPLPYDRDAEFADELSTFATIDFEGLRDQYSGVWNVELRARVRYLAALWPELSLPQLADTIHYVIDNQRLSVHTLRLILDGRSLSDPSRRTGEVPVEAIQTAGRVLMRGGDQTSAARASGLSRDTVRAIDGYLGLTQAWRDRIVEEAVIGVREGESVRAFAGRVGLPKSTAHEFQKKAVSVLKELGEL